MTALIALGTPVLLSVLALGLAGMVPDVAAAGVKTPQFSLHIPILAPEPTPTPTAAPTPGPLAVIPPGRAQINVPILMYHYIRVNPNPTDQVGYNLSVTPTDFSAQMDWLQKNDYHTVTLSDLRAYFQEGKPLPARAIVLTFDDGYIDFYTTAFPVLQAHGFTAVSYVVSGFMNSPRYMSSAQVQEIDQAGIEIGVHTFNHVNLTSQSAAGLVMQVNGSKQTIEQVVGHQLYEFCYPSGKFNNTVVAAVQAAGLQSSTTEEVGTAHTWADRFTWSRIRVNGGEKLPQFTANLGTPEKTVNTTPAPSA